jgi:nucleoside phosphorylase
MPLPPVLVCFAVKEEAELFQEVLVSRSRALVLITGMGKKNAEDSFRKALLQVRPAMVISCGFAGGLNPQLPADSIVFEAADPEIETALLGLGAYAVKFHCAERVASTVAEKSALYQSSGADAVEMESAVIGKICNDTGIPFATVRIILDAANENLPLDFNLLMNAKHEMSYLKLTGALLKSPAKIGELKKFQKRCQAAALKLAATLVRIIPG